MLGRQLTTRLLPSATCSLLRPLGSRCLAGRWLSGGPVFWTEMSRPHSCHTQQSVPVTPSIPDGNPGEPASKAHYFKMGENSLPSCLKTTDVQAACICKPYIDPGMESRQPRCGAEALWECGGEGRHLLPEACGSRQAGRSPPGTTGASPARYRAVCVLARAAVASVLLLLLPGLFL